MTIFNGNQLAKIREDKLKQLISTSFACKKLTIAAVLFKEDAGSRLYTKLKSEAASRVGIDYVVHEFSLSSTTQEIKTKIEELNLKQDITGIIIQKPWRKTWFLAQSEDVKNKILSNVNSKKYEREQFATWWNALTGAILEKKDVDGLHPNTIKQIKDGTWKENGKVLPATCQAVLSILEEVEKIYNFHFSTHISKSRENKLGESDAGKVNLPTIATNKKLGDVVNRSYQRRVFTQDKGVKVHTSNKKYIVLGKSDLLGIPLFYELKRQGKNVEIIASRELKERMKSGQKLLDASVIISATGRKGLITGNMIQNNVIIIDVGEPKPDVDFESVSKKASFITPVPGGVGPMTVISLLENCVELAV